MNQRYRLTRRRLLRLVAAASLASIIASGKPLEATARVFHSGALLPAASDPIAAVANGMLVGSWKIITDPAFNIPWTPRTKVNFDAGMYVGQPAFANDGIVSQAPPTGANNTSDVENTSFAAPAIRADGTVAYNDSGGHDNGGDSAAVIFENLSVVCGRIIAGQPGGRWSRHQNGGMLLATTFAKPSWSFQSQAASMKWITISMVANPTITFSTGANSAVVSSTTGVVVGQYVYADGIPLDTQITSVDPSTNTVSWLGSPTTKSQTGVISAFGWPRGNPLHSYATFFFFPGTGLTGNSGFAGASQGSDTTQRSIEFYDFGIDPTVANPSRLFNSPDTNRGFAAACGGQMGPVDYCDLDGNVYTAGDGVGGNRKYLYRWINCLSPTPTRTVASVSGLLQWVPNRGSAIIDDPVLGSGHRAFFQNNLDTAGAGAPGTWNLFGDITGASPTSSVGSYDTDLTTIFSSFNDPRAVAWDPDNKRIVMWEGTFKIAQIAPKASGAWPVVDITAVQGPLGNGNPNDIPTNPTTRYCRIMKVPGYNLYLAVLGSNVYLYRIS